MQVSFVLGKAKLTPSRATTIPRLELCTAVLGVELTELVTQELDMDLETATYYSDSKVVLGYITNESRRFYVYVSNRVEQIRKSSSSSQWRYVPTHLNPADLATCSVHAEKLDGSPWLNRPQFLHAKHPTTDTPMGSLTADSRERPRSPSRGNVKGPHHPQTGKLIPWLRPFLQVLPTDHSRQSHCQDDPDSAILLRTEEEFQKMKTPAG